MHILTAEPLPFDANQVTPGVIGFAVTAAIAVAVILLLWDFNRRVREPGGRHRPVGADHDRGRTLSVPGRHYRAIVAATRVLPRRALLAYQSIGGR